MRAVSGMSRSKILCTGLWILRADGNSAQPCLQGCARLFSRIVEREVDQQRFIRPEQCGFQLYLVEFSDALSRPVGEVFAVQLLQISEDAAVISRL